MKSINAFAIIHTQGYGSIWAIAQDRSQCILNYVSMILGHDRNVNHNDWWKANAKNRKLRIIKVRVSTNARNIALPYNNWSEKPKKDRCEVDTGGLNVSQCGNLHKHTYRTSEGSKVVCTNHRQMLKDGRALQWV